MSIVFKICATFSNGNVNSFFAVVFLCFTRSRDFKTFRAHFVNRLCRHHLQPFFQTTGTKHAISNCYYRFSCNKITKKRFYFGKYFILRRDFVSVSILSDISVYQPILKKKFFSSLKGTLPVSNRFSLIFILWMLARFISSHFGYSRFSIKMGYIFLQKFSISNTCLFFFNFLPFF